jgi:hypothetical protein
MAVGNAEIAVLALVVGLPQIVSRPGRLLEKSLFVGVFIAAAIGMFAGSRGLWLSARPHSDATMLRWRRLYFRAWALTMCVFGCLWLWW